MLLCPESDISWPTEIRGNEVFAAQEAKAKAHELQR